PGQQLIDLLREMEIGIVTLPPSALAALPMDELPALSAITVAGEACPVELAAKWASCCRFFNLYGPTEATIWSTAAQFIEGSERLTIGRPIANVKIYLLDSHLQPVPIGVAGELHI